MSDVGIGHNSGEVQEVPATRYAKDQLRAITERINTLEDQKKDISEDIKDVYAEAKSNGFNAAALRVIVRQQRADARKAAELQADVDAYMVALGLA